MNRRHPVSMGSGIFITGTDTGVGKTFFACGLAALLRDMGYKVGVMKPAETGCAETDGARFPQDAFALKQAAGCEQALETICRYRLRDPLAPSAAAAREGIQVDVSLLAQTYEEIRAGHDVTLVEGAGGLLVPLLAHYTFADWAALVKLPLIVVAANRLGAINHLLLTLEHASCRGLRVLGYVWNHLESAPTLAAETNPEALRVLTALPCLGNIPWVADSKRERAFLAGLFQDRLDLRFLQGVL